MIRTKLKQLFTHHIVQVILAVAALTYLAWRNRFVQDDAFISFRYAENFVAGHGLVWNVGEHVEGYTNFLWTIAMAIPFKFGIEPVAFAHTLGLSCFVLTLIVTYLIVVELLASHTAALVALVLLGTSVTFNAWATSGMETQMNASLIAALAYLTLRALKRERVTMLSAVAWSILACAALMTRLDSGVFLAAFGPFVLSVLFRQRSSRAEKLVTGCVAAVALVLPIAMWLAWKVRFYGDVLPNTYYVKMPAGLHGLHAGASYLFDFSLSTGLVFPLAVIAPFFLKGAFFQSTGARLLVATTLIWSAYVLKIGGDFMEFRFMVALLPLLYVLLAGFLFSARPSASAVTVMLCTSLVVSSCGRMTAFEHDGPPDVGWLSRVTQSWSDIGPFIGEVFDHDQSLLIATKAAGALPFYSKLPTVDMLGLNDKWIARNGIFNGTAVVGHTHMAPLSYLLERHVNLIFGNPWIVPKDVRTVYTNAMLIDMLVDGPSGTNLPATAKSVTNLPATAKVVEIPIQANFKIVALYMTPHPAVERAIASGRISVLPLPTE